MSTISIRDLSSTRELDREAMTTVRGGTSYLYPKFPSYPGHVSFLDASKWTNQTQVANVSNTAVGIGGPNVINQVGAISQSQVA
ncbi:MAG: hypothetical protein JJU06_08380 [Ectothiorhodospiraceae bacterium]|nr:hypothetical protein [Ectothiorhodospiraceae bacterium]MCH8506816.1 hypothetical protein [Ectothiorhodospiraceae bacterium]